MDEATQVIASFLSDRSALPEDGGPSGLTLGSVVNLFTLLLRPGEKLVAYADWLEDLGEERGSARQSVDLVALTDMRMVRSRIANDAFVWKETPLPAEAALGVEAFVGRAGENDPRWWIADEPEPARFSNPPYYHVIWASDRTSRTADLKETWGRERYLPCEMFH